MPHILNLPFAYEVDIQMPRKRGASAQMLKDFVLVQPAVATDDEAPVAFEVWRDSAGVRYRSHEGMLFKEVMAEDGQGVSPREFEEQAGFDALALRMRDTRLRWWDHATFPTPPDVPSPIGLQTLEELLDGIPVSGVRMFGDDRARRLAQATPALVDGLLVCGGTMWSSHMVREPHWSVEFEPERLSFSMRLRDGEVAGAAPFRLDRRDHAMAYAEEVARAHLGPHAEVGVDGERVEIARPDLLRRDDIVRLGASVRRVLLGPRGLRPWEIRPGARGAGVLDAANALVAAAEAASATPTGPESLDVLTRLEAFHGACDEGGDVPESFGAPISLTRGAVRRFRFECRHGSLPAPSIDVADAAAMEGLAL